MAMMEIDCGLRREEATNLKCAPRWGALQSDWARRERQGDLQWIQDNLSLFLSTAKAAFDVLGRGAIVVDTTSQPTGQGNPFGYLPQAIFESGDDEDIKRMVGNYDPEQEVVIVLIKPNDHTSTYRVGTQKKKP
jgi:hypothetical protein